MQIHIKKLNARGFAHHLLLPVLAIIVVAGIGSYTLHAIHATAAQYYSGPCTTKTSSSAPCVNQAKDLLDGLQHAGWRSYKTATKAGSGVFAYGGQYYLNLNGTYDAATQAALKTLTSSSVGLTPGNDSSDGWQLFCTTVAKSGMQLTSNKNSGALDFKNGNKTTQTMAQIFTATCGAVTLAKSGGTTTPKSSTSTSSTAASSACASKTFQQGAKDSGSSHCVQYVQQLMNARDSYIAMKVNSTSYINSQSLSDVASTTTNLNVGFLNTGSFGSTSTTYTSQLTTWISNIQKWDNAPNATYIKSYFNMTPTAFGQTFRPKGALPTTGVTEPKTWYDMCEWVDRMPASARAVTNSTDYTGGTPNSAGTNKTNMWYLRSYIRTGVSAASSAGCQG